MKKNMIIAAMAMVGLLFASCNKINYKSFVGTWGVEKIVYENYNTDWQGQPIPGSIVTETHTYDPEDIGHGIQLVFKSDKTGELRDNDVDSLQIVDDNNDTVYIPCPDTTLVTRFTYSYDAEAGLLYLNLTDYADTYMLKISDMTDKSFTYENNYGIAEDNRTYFETAYLKRLSDNASKSETRGPKNGKCHPRYKGSLFGDK